jgi:hypothetical protein
MLKRLKRPGYLFVALIILTIYFYGQYKKREIKRHQEAILNTYKSYGEDILGSIRSRDLGTLQSRFESEQRKRITLEDISIFISTLHLDKIGTVKWKKVKGDDNNISLSGDILVDKNISYPIDMMVVKRGKDIVLKRLIVNGQMLRAKESNFPLNNIFETNSSGDGRILIKRCGSADDLDETDSSTK